MSDETISTSSGTGFHYHSFSFTGNVESVGVRHASGGGIYFMGIWFDGKQLVDDTETVADVPSIASTTRANPTAGFSIATVTYGSNTNETYGHGLNAAPEFVIAKNLDSASSWYCYHKSLGKDKYIVLNSNDAEGSLANSWGTADPTSTEMGLRSGTSFGSGNTSVIYAFTSVSGYSAFGSYEGNNSFDGPFIWTGFKPAFLLIKSIDTAQYWYMADSSRSPTNDGATEGLWANTNDTEFTYDVDILSNGFKHRNQSANLNSANTFIYAAWAENPFQANGGLAR